MAAHSPTGEGRIVSILGAVLGGGAFTLGLNGTLHVRKFLRTSSDVTSLRRLATEQIDQ